MTTRLDPTGYGCDFWRQLSALYPGAKIHEPPDLVAPLRIYSYINLPEKLAFRLPMLELRMAICLFRFRDPPSSCGHKQGRLPN